VQGSLLVGKDGILIASDLKVEVNDEAIGAVASNVLAALRRALDRMQLGKFKRYVVSGKAARIAMYQVGPAILMLLLERDANLGLITIELREAIQRIEKEMIL
jgi:predicted regulator of Ras-like GTPase activity (Roadblock/LC7/MglB family)